MDLKPWVYEVAPHIMLIVSIGCMLFTLRDEFRERVKGVGERRSQHKAKPRTEHRRLQVVHDHSHINEDDFLACTECKLTPVGRRYRGI